MVSNLMIYRGHCLRPGAPEDSALLPPAICGSTEPFGAGATGLEPAISDVTGRETAPMLGQPGRKWLGEAKFGEGWGRIGCTQSGTQILTEGASSARAHFAAAASRAKADAT